MQWSDIPFRPSSRTLRQFAAWWIMFFGGLAGWQWLLRGHAALALVFLGLAGTAGPLGFWRPALIRPLFVGWMCLAFPVGWLISHLVLACVYFGLFTPLALIFRVIGRDALALRPRLGQNTYWLPKTTPDDVRSYFRQS